MDTQLLKIEIDIENHYTVSSLYQEIQERLRKYGHPLNWIVTDADKENQKVYVNAIFLSSELNWRNSTH